MDMSHFSTFTRLGSSSREKRRSSRPTRVIRGSPSRTYTPAPIVSAFGTIVRSFQSSKGSPWRPTRRCRYRTGPRLSRRIATAAIAITGDATASAAAATATSRARLAFGIGVMRILYLHQFFVTRAGVGGTRSYEFARRFVALGHEVRIVTAAGAAGPGTSRVDGIEVVAVRGAYSDYVRATSLSYPRRMLAFGRFAVSATAAALRGPRPDVVYATSPPLTMALPALAVAGARRGPPLWGGGGLWAGGPIQKGALRNPLLRRAARALERFVYRRAARLVALSPGIRVGMIAAGAPAERIALVPNASDLAMFRPH